MFMKWKSSGYRLWGNYCVYRTKQHSDKGRFDFFGIYFPKKANFHQRVKYDFPPLAIALKDYNAVRKMLGYEPITLQTDEFATHWHRAAEDKDIENYIAKHTLLETDAGTLNSVRTPCFRSLWGNLSIIFIQMWCISYLTR